MLGVVSVRALVFVGLGVCVEVGSCWRLSWMSWLEVWGWMDVDCTWSVCWDGEAEEDRIGG